ncbi:DUF2179 domain-containing protein [Mycoplasmopsis citelli]|uniref:DUF2179 domain-containing protein n=1 Tax=Mycoplasmopsis citelli TaxID=171281 RepID=UPI002114A8E4|nr:DUF2179 domain-containing protein [Mycoplasmopsis citelli]UUD36009.1 DUF2179 domain-containing protein [Mycoplasmopsis citelli]
MFWRKNNKDSNLNKPQVIEKAHTVYKKTRMSNFGLKLNYFYSYLPMPKLIFITVTTAIIFGVISVFFVKNVGIYNFGLAAFGQAIARLIIVKLAGSVSPGLLNGIDQLVFWLAYIILSIPIFVLGYKKIGKIFGHLTVIFLVVSSLVSFSIGFINGANDVYVIGNFGNGDVKDLIKDIAKNSNISVNMKENLLKLSPLIPLSWQEGGNIIALIIIAIFYGVILAWIFAIIQIIGGTAGVTGILGEWYSNETQKSFGTISGYLNIVIIIISVLVGSWLPGSLYIQIISNLVESKNINHLLSDGSLKTLEKLKENAWGFEFYLSPNFVATFITNVAYIMVLNKIYPKFKLVKVEIFSKKYSLIEEKITNDRKIVIKLTSFVAQSHNNEEQTHILKTVTLFRQVPRMLKKIHQYDPDAFVAISEVSSIDGYIYLPSEKF